jgi:4-hydroxythreonine-4-phosphate dehydrogenase
VSDPSDNRRVRLAVTLGDPRGIGPEVTHAAAAAIAADAAAIAADAAAIAAHPDAPELLFVGPTGTRATPGDGLPANFHSTGVWETGTTDLAVAGSHAARAIEAATALALRGEVDGIVTAPIDKAALRAAGYDFP